MEHRKPENRFVPAYDENSVLKLIIATGVTYIMFHFSKVVMLIIGFKKEETFSILFPNVTLGSADVFLSKWWTLFSYPLVHYGFWDWATNMIWLFFLGSAWQAVAGYKQVISLFISACIIGGICFIGSQLLPFDFFHWNGENFLGVQAGVMALGVAALTFDPKFRVFITPQFSFPAWLMTLFFTLLTVVVYRDNAAVLSLCLGGAITGFVYGRMAMAGFNPGERISKWTKRISDVAEPDEDKIREMHQHKRDEVIRKAYREDGNKPG